MRPSPVAPEVTEGAYAHAGAVMVEKDSPGVSFGKREELMGFRGIPTADIALEVQRHDAIAAGESDRRPDPL